MKEGKGNEVEQGLGSESIFFRQMMMGNLLYKICCETGATVVAITKRKTE